MNPIVVMPDFFLDRIIKLRSREEFFNGINDKARSGGGSIRGIPSTDIKGGNAANIAYCLSKLGVKVILFTVADDIGSAILKQSFSRFKDVNLLISSGRHGSTTAFEFPDESGVRVNVMISDVGDNSNFGPDRINSPQHLNYLKTSDAVVVVNWGSNLKGTQLAEHAFKNSPKSLHFIDPADIETRKQDFRDSLADIAELTDVISINENEYNSLAQVVGLEHLELATENIVLDDVKNAVKQLAEKIGISVDLHTRKGAAWSNGRETIFVRAIRVDIRTLTGAGDSWNSANIIGYLAALNATERLTFSNAAVSLYLRSQIAEPPTNSEVFELLERIGV
jgi:ribokinase